MSQSKENPEAPVQSDDLLKHTRNKLYKMEVTHPMKNISVLFMSSQI
jgi:hypothetical protein